MKKKMMMIKGKYIFFSKNLDHIYGDSGRQPWHPAPYRKTGVQYAEWRAVKLLRLLRKDKSVVNIKWIEKIEDDTKIITVHFKVKS